MKRIILLFIALLMMSCSTEENEHTVAIRQFLKGLKNKDLELIGRFSTETTLSVARQVVEQNRNIKYCDANGGKNYIVTGKNLFQYNVDIVKDSLSADGKSAWVWLYISKDDITLMVPLSAKRGKWLVDIPIEFYRIL